MTSIEIINQLPNITIGKVYENRREWEHLMTNFVMYYKVELTIAEQIIMEDYCSGLQGRMYYWWNDDWRKLSQNELIARCFSLLVFKLESMRKIKLLLPN